MAYKMLGGGSTINTVVSDMNQNILELKNREVTEIFKDDTGTRRVILDKDGLRTSAPGVDVVTANQSQLTFNSNQNVFKITDVNTYNVNCPPTITQTYTIAHHKTYIPIVQGYLRTGQRYIQLPTTVQYNRDDVAGFVKLNSYFEIYSDETNVYIRIFNASGTRVPTTGDYTVKVYLLQESAG